MHGNVCFAGCVETAYIFPGIGLGSIVSRTTRLRDEAFIAAAEALASLVTDGAHNGVYAYSVALPSSPADSRVLQDAVLWKAFFACI